MTISDMSSCDAFCSMSFPAVWFASVISGCSQTASAALPLLVASLCSTPLLLIHCPRHHCVAPHARASWLSLSGCSALNSISRCRFSHFQHGGPVRIPPNHALTLSLSPTLKPSEIARNSTGVLKTWICCIQMAESNTVGHGISLKSRANRRNQAAVRIIVLTTKATWDH
jgi:hypothetical protein